MKANVGPLVSNLVNVCVVMMILTSSNDLFVLRSTIVIVRVLWHLPHKWNGVTSVIVYFDTVTQHLWVYMCIFLVFRLK